jgi:hypothetical protein
LRNEHLQDEDTFSDEEDGDEDASSREGNEDAEDEDVQELTEGISSYPPTDIRIEANSRQLQGKQALSYYRTLI